MKRILLLTTIIALALSINSAKAQSIGGQDLNIYQIESKYTIKPKISIADNGWIYILTPYKDGNNTYSGASGFKVHRSKDGGKTYEGVREKWNNDGWIVSDVNMKVTGNGTDITIWIARVSNHISTKTGEVLLNKFDANGENEKTVFEERSDGVSRNWVSLSTSFRSPGAESSPFGVAIAVSGYNHNDGNKAFVDFIYSKNAGTNFTKKCIFYESTSVGRVDISLGACKSGASSHTLAGIVFEKEMNSNGQGNIGFVSSNLNTNVLSNVINVNTGYGSPPYDKQCWYPQIQYMSNKDYDPSIQGVGQYHNFIITYIRQFVNEKHIIVVYPKNSFVIGTATYNDVGRYHFDKDGFDFFDASLSYDKKYNHYLLTYTTLKLGAPEFAFNYKFVKFDQINKLDSWKTIGDGMYSKKSLNGGWGYYPAVDINPTKSLAHFVWTERLPDGARVFTDFEGSTIDVEIPQVDTKSIDIYPNPAQDIVNITMPESDSYTATLYDLNGKALKEFKFNSDTYELDINALPAGVYILKANSDKKIYSSKIIKK